MESLSRSKVGCYDISDYFPDYDDDDVDVGGRIAGRTSDSMIDGIVDGMQRGTLAGPQDEIDSLSLSLQGQTIAIVPSTANRSNTRSNTGTTHAPISTYHRIIDSRFVADDVAITELRNQTMVMKMSSLPSSMPSSRDSSRALAPSMPNTLFHVEDVLVSESGMDVEDNDSILSPPVDMVTLNQDPYIQTTTQSITAPPEPTDSSEPRIDVVLDCANIGWFYGGTRFDVMGIVAAIRYFERLPFIRLISFLPASYVRKKPNDGSSGNTHMNTDEWEVMNGLVQSRAVTVVPAGEHDDIYILRFANDHDGYIISNDFYVDHKQSIRSPQRQHAFECWIERKRCAYTFVYGNFYLSPTCELATLIDDYHASVEMVPS